MRFFLGNCGSVRNKVKQRNEPRRKKMRCEDVASAQQNNKGTSQAINEGGPQNDSGQSTQEPVRDSWTYSPRR